MMHYKNINNTDLFLSQIGLGTSSFSSIRTKSDLIKAKNMVHQAIEYGINYFDTAPYYGQGHSERALGYCLKSINRDKFFISTKIGRLKTYYFDYSKKSILKTLDQSLESLNCNYIDILYCHDIEFTDLHSLIDITLPFLETLKKSGKIRFYGISGYPIKTLEYVANNHPVDILLSYGHYCLINDELKNLPQNENVNIINAAPFCMGLLTAQGAPIWHPASKSLKNQCASLITNLMAQGIEIEPYALTFSLRNQRVLSTLIGIDNQKHLDRIISWLETGVAESTLQTVDSTFEPLRNSSWVSGKKINNL